MLFKDYHVKLICDGTKVQTRRIVNLKRPDLKPWKVGSVHKIMTKYDKDGFQGYVLITGVRQQVLADISFRDAVREGYESIDEYWDAFKKIYGKCDPELLVWVVDFIYLGKEIQDVCFHCSHHHERIVRIACHDCKFCYSFEQRGKQNHFAKRVVYDA